ncbi:hypothetical protein ACFL54_02665 [Planctomycetota bacterium]
MAQGRQLLAWLCLTIALCMIIGGCEGKSKQSSSSKPAVEEKPAQKEPATSYDDELEKLLRELQELREARSVRGEEGSGGGASDKRLDEFREQHVLQSQQRRTLAASYVQQARGYQQGGDLEKAYKLSRDAVELDPSNSDACKLYNELANLLGKRPGQIADLMDRMAQEHRAKREHAKIEIQHRYDKGLNFYHDKEFDKALEMFDSAMELIKVQPYSVNIENLAKQLEGAIKLTEQKQREHDVELDLQRKRAAKYLEEVKSARASENLKQRINRIYQEAVRAFQKKDYEKSEKLANLILVELPNSREARALAEASREAYFALRMNLNIQTKMREWRETFLSMEEIIIPWTQIIRFPKRADWDKITARALQIRGAGRKEDDEAQPIVIAALESANIPRWSSRPDDSIYDCFTMLSDISNVNIVPHFTDDDDVDTAAPRLELSDTNAEDVLNLILRLRNLGRIVEGTSKKPIIYVVPANRAVGKKILKVYDVAGIAAKVRDFPGPEVMLTDDEDAFETKMPGQPEDGGLKGEEIVEIIREYIASETWATEDDVFIKYRPGGQLLVKHTRQVHQEIGQLMGNIRHTGGILIHIETRFLTVSDDVLSDLGITLGGMGTGTGPLAMSADFDDVNNGVWNVTTDTFRRTPGIIQNLGAKGFLRSRMENLLDQAVTANNLTNSGGITMALNFIDDIQLAAMISMVKKTERGNTVTTTRLTLFNAQRANIVVTRNNAIIPDYDAQVATSVAIADPIPAVVRDGIFLDVRATASPDKRYITLDLKPTIATLKRPIATQMVQLAEDVTVTLQLPELEVQQVRTTARVPDGGIVMMGGMSTCSDSDASASTPWIEHIPVLKFFFKRQAKTKARGNTLILVKTKIIDLREEEINQSKYR